MGSLLGFGVGVGFAVSFEFILDFSFEFNFELSSGLGFGSSPEIGSGPSSIIGAGISLPLLAGLTKFALLLAFGTRTPFSQMFSLAGPYGTVLPMARRGEPVSATTIVHFHPLVAHLSHLVGHVYVA